MTLAVRYTAARTLDTAPALSAPPGPGEVELAPAYVGICGTDLHIFHGDMDARVRMPAVLGHEMSGRVVRVGAGVEGWQAGETRSPMDGPRHMMTALARGVPDAADRQGNHHGAATVDELLHDLAEDTIHALPTPRPSRGSPRRFCRCEVAPHPRGCAAHRRS
jgi:NADPH:quinone reductase-like Zn-dependent oxidoreductase